MRPGEQFHHHDAPALRGSAFIFLWFEGRDFGEVLLVEDQIQFADPCSDDIGLVVCDLGLPRLGGREAFLKMKESRPGVRAIVASGYLEPAIRSEMLKAGVIDTIQKPYDFNDLLAKIRSIIAPPPVADDHPELF